MITELMLAMVERAPAKARAIQNLGRGRLEAYATSLADAAMAEVAVQNVPETDPNLERMVREIAFLNALEEDLTPLQDGSTDR